MSYRLSTRTVSMALAACLGSILAMPAAPAPPRDAAVGGEGELFLVRQGTYGEIFPEEGLADPSGPALAVEVTRSDRGRELLRVPGSELADAIHSASVVYEDESETLFVLYQTRTSIHWRLNLVGLRDGTWSEPIEISGNTYVWKSSPQIAVTRDSFQTQEEDGSFRSWSRTVVHLVWAEQGSSSEPQVQYSPVTLIDGVYTGGNPVYRLDELDLVGSEELPLPSLNPALAEAPRIEAGRNGHSVVLGFVDSSTGRLVSLLLELLPGEISFLGDEIRAQIIDVGRDLGPDPPDKLAQAVHAKVDSLGETLSLHPGLTTYLADTARDEVLAADPSEPVAALAERIRAQIIDVGARMNDRGFDRVASRSTHRILELPDLGAAGNQRPVDLISVVRTSVRPVPVTGTRGAELHLSETGQELVVSWHEDGVVYFRESHGEGWSETRSLQLESELDLVRAHEILDQRADGRTRSD